MKLIMIMEDGRGGQLMDLPDEDSIEFNMQILGAVSYNLLPDDFNIHGDHPTLMDEIKGPLPGHLLYEGPE